MWSFRGSCANRGSGMEQASSDVATGVGLEPTGGIAAAQTLSGRRRYDRSGTPSYWGPHRSAVRWGEGGNPKHSRRKPGSYETGIPEPCGGISDVVTPAGLEPGIAAVKGRCPIRLDERAMSAPVGAEYFYAITRI